MCCECEGGCWCAECEGAGVLSVGAGVLSVRVLVC